MFNRMKKIALVLCLTALFSGCVKTSNTVTINQDKSAILEKGFSIDESSSTVAAELKDSQKRFVQSFKENYSGSSIMKYQEGKDSKIIGTVKFEDIVKEDVFKKEKAYTSANKGNKLNCQKKKDATDCSFDVNVNLNYPELEKKLSELGMTLKDLDAYELTFKLPARATSHNADFFDNDKFIYVWEIPWGVSTKVKLQFSIPD